MADIMTPTLGESVTEATVARWAKKPGDAVRKDEILVELETDKVSLEVAAPADGVLTSISAEEGATVEPGAVLGHVTEGAVAAAPKPAAPKAEAPKAAEPAPAPAPAPAPVAAPAPKPAAAAAPLAPSAQRIVAENNLDGGAISGTGKDGRVTKGDALAALEARANAPAAAPAASAPREIHAR
ncbi:MAG: biotin/lipoyl-containing protein, partial [Phenylobacterium sp.]|nr:biotin/lipoyl-containing protein [Phenylobacterium sp.]